jgi:hypothetical protein
MMNDEAGLSKVLFIGRYTKDLGLLLEKKVLFVLNGSKWPFSTAFKEVYRIIIVTLNSFNNSYIIIPLLLLPATCLLLLLLTFVLILSHLLCS